MDDAVLVDASVALHAMGEESVWREPCRELLRDLVKGSGRGYASTEMIQEVAHHRLRMTGDRRRAAPGAGCAG